MLSELLLQICMEMTLLIIIIITLGEIFMKTKRYEILEKRYLQLGSGAGDIMSMLVHDIVTESNNALSPLTNDKNDYGYYMNTMRFWLLTQMYMEVEHDFYYIDEAYAMMSSVLGWIGKVLKKDYDRYLMTQILLGDDGVYFWSLKKEFKFIIKKVSNVDTMTRWIMRFIELAEKDGYNDFSSIFAKNALSKFEKHKILNEKMSSFLEKHILC